MAAELWNVIAAREQIVTYHVLSAATATSLLQDARQGILLAMARLAVWKWLRALQVERPSGVEFFGKEAWEKGPWTAERILKVVDLGVH